MKFKYNVERELYGAQVQFWAVKESDSNTIFGAVFTLENPADMHLNLHLSWDIRRIEPCVHISHPLWRYLPRRSLTHNIEFSYESDPTDNPTISDGCANNAPTEKDFTGFMSDYSDLKPVELTSGTTVLRWVHHDIQARGYSSIIL